MHLTEFNKQLSHEATATDGSEETENMIILTQSRPVLHQHPHLVKMPSIQADFKFREKKEAYIDKMQARMQPGKHAMK